MNATPEIATGNRSLRVLVVDDSEADRALVGIRLGEAWPFTPDLVLDYAADGTQALAKLQDQRFALVVCDWRKPGSNGADVLRQMRDHGWQIPVVVVSGLEREEIVEDLELFRAAFLNKNALNATTLHNAILASLSLRGGGLPGDNLPGQLST
ncbi:response regulator [bacterium]|nr:response regulator [bacterium]